MHSIQKKIGKTIRLLRKKQNLTLVKMAELCNCSPSLLSQIETGNVTPSLGILKFISDTLNVQIGDIIDSKSMPEGNYDIKYNINSDLYQTSNLNSTKITHCTMKSSQRKILTTEGTVIFQLLTKYVEVPFEFILNEWPPGASTGDNLYRHEGFESGLLLEGELDVEINGTTCHMEQGDTITLESNTLHRISNPGKKKAVAVWVNSIPWVFTTK